MRIVVGMSGGVDSSVAALLLRRQGHEVIGLFMKNWEEKDEAGHCTADKDFEDVKSVCALLDIPYYGVNFAKEYRERVFDYFLSEYEKGRTPNPDVLCNREIKFGPFLEYARKLNAEKIATGHFAGTETINGRVYLTKAKDQSKDQTYFLHQLSQEQLTSVIFPLKDLTKDEVRKIAAGNNLPVANKKDSTGVCFIGERNFRKFLQKYLPGKSGDIVDIKSGAKVGEHIGLMHYTTGQRRGLDIGGISCSSGSRWFVVKKDFGENVLFVSQGEDDCLFSSSLAASEVNFISDMPADAFECFAKVRYRQEEQRAIVTLTKSKVKGDIGMRVDFKERQRAVTSGQYVVLYDKKNCLGGGVIDTVF